MEEDKESSLPVGFCAGAGLILLLAVFMVVMPRTAQAVPAYATQTGQPCSACHVGAFGPQLKQTGRDFKLYGYVSSDGLTHFPPIAVTSQTSYEHTNKSQAGGAAPGFKGNGNIAEDQVSAYYAGRITGNIGAFSQWTYDGILHKFAWDNNDIRAALEKENFLGHDVVAGITMNNSVTVQDIWNSTPTWGFPYNSSGLAPTPSEATLIDGGLAENVAGVGVYSMWDNLVYVEATAYDNLSRSVQTGLGGVDVKTADTFSGAIPYWRLALQHDFKNNYFEVGTYGLTARRYPGGVTTAGTDSITDVAFDTNYQYTGSNDHFVSAHATLITEDMKLDANQALNGTNTSDHLDTLRGDISYSFQNSWTPTVQLFKTWGSKDAALYPASASGSPDSAGYVAELAYVPLGKPGSPAFDWFNGRIALQYVGYTKFEGSSSHASDNNTLFLNLWVAIDPFTILYNHTDEDECTNPARYCK